MLAVTLHISHTAHLTLYNIYYCTILHTAGTLIPTPSSLHPSQNAHHCTHCPLHAAHFTLCPAHSTTNNEDSRRIVAHYIRHSEDCIQHTSHKSIPENEENLFIVLCIFITICCCFYIYYLKLVVAIKNFGRTHIKCLISLKEGFQTNLSLTLIHFFQNNLYFFFFFYLPFLDFFSLL